MLSLFGMGAESEWILHHVLCAVLAAFLMGVIIFGSIEYDANGLPLSILERFLLSILDGTTCLTGGAILIGSLRGFR